MIIREDHVFKWIYRNGLIFVAILPRDNRDKLNFQVTSSTRSYFSQKFQLVIIGLSANFHVTSTKLLYFLNIWTAPLSWGIILSNVRQFWWCLFPLLHFFLGKCYLAIIRAVRIFNWLHKIYHIFEKFLPRDNRDSLNFQVTSSKLPYFWQKLQLLLIGAMQISKSHQQNCLIFAKSTTSW